MSTETPRQMLENRVKTKFLGVGYEDRWATDMARQAVDEFYNEDQSGTYFALVAAESYQIIIDSIPPFASHIMAAFQSMQSAVSGLADATAQYVEMANKAKIEVQVRPTRFNPSGLAMTDGPFLASASPITHHVDPPVSMDIDVANEVSLEDTGRPYRHLPPAVEGDNTLHTFDPDEDPPEVIEVTEREWHLALARRLRQLGCTYSQLKAMHDRGDFVDSHHHSAWFAFGDTVSIEQLDRANFVLDNLIKGDAGNIDMDDAAIERAEKHYPTDRLTGAPHHFVVNGDHSGCGCGGHLVDCAIWDTGYWRHKPSICGISRTLCNHSPRHHYGQPCDDYHENLVDDNTIGGPSA